MTGTPGTAATPERPPRRRDQDRGSAVSATSTTTGLPDRYRPLDQVGPDEPTPTGVIRCWRAKDRVLNRDVAIRVHTPAGEAAHAWITRALTAGGLATPALAMVYDASEGTGDPTAPGGAAYVVNEWIEGETLADRLRRGPLPERDTRTVLRRLAEGVAEAHRVGLAVGGLTPEHVVLRPNGLVGLRSVPAATGTVEGDIAALGALLEVCLTGIPAPGEQSPRPLTGSSDLLALVRRTRSPEPGQGIASVAAMVATLKERPRSGVSLTTQPQRSPDEGDGVGRRRTRDRVAPPVAAGAAGAASTAALPAPGAAQPQRRDPQTMPPVPPPGRAAAGGLGGDTISASTVAPRSGAYGPGSVSGYGNYAGEPDDEDGALGVLGDGVLGDEDEYGEHPYADAGPATQQTGTSAPRRRLVVAGLALLALAVVVALALWIGNTLLSVTGSVDQDGAPAPSSSATAGDEPASSAAEEPAAGQPAEIASAAVFDPFGDGEPENDDDVPLTFDGDESTAWSTLQYRGSAAFGNLKPGVGIVYDLGSEVDLSGVTVTSSTPGATVEIRTGGAPDGDLDSFATAGSGEVEGTTEFAFDEAVSARYVLVWLTGLVESGEGFSADIAEVGIQTAG